MSLGLRCCLPSFPYHGFIGEHVSLATHRPTLVYLGDSAAEEDYALTAFGFAATHQLPVLFVCEDNDLSILTTKQERRSWEIVDAVRAMGMAAETIDDDPAEIYSTVQWLLKQLPAYVSIKSCRHHWHAGSGMDGPPKWDRLLEMRETVAEAEEIEGRANEEIDRLWAAHLD